VNTLNIVVIREGSVLEVLHIQHRSGLAFKACILAYYHSVNVGMCEGILEVIKNRVLSADLLACGFGESLCDIVFKVSTEPHRFVVFLGRKLTELLCPYCIRT
jgi:hypothetical protein